MEDFADNFLDIILGVSFVGSLLIIWFKTNFLTEYFPNSRFLKSQEYLKYKKENLESAPLYYEFLVINYYSFWTKLLSCPFCIGLWLAIGYSLIFGAISFFLTYYLFGLILYGIVNKLYE